MGKEASQLISAQAVEAYLRQHGHPTAVVLSLAPLGASTQEGLKSYGYGRPLCASFTSAGQRQSVVIRTMSPDPFGHERRADRTATLILAYDTFAQIPRHIRPLDHGAFDGTGQLVSMPAGEAFLITEFVEGVLYATDLNEMQERDRASAQDLDRAKALAKYLAELHATPASPAQYIRSVRDTIGSGEGMFGLIDGYPAEASRQGRFQALEVAAVRWRWRLRQLTHRCRRTHGDFHPFNILFRSGTDFSALDCSRGAAGDPADDVTCLSINYLFFALQHHGSCQGALRQAWQTFWQTYLQQTGDAEILQLVAPYFAWRSLVLASPLWYPNVAAPIRERILTFAERLLAGEPFTPDSIDTLLR